MRFYIDDVEKDAVSGEMGWTRMAYVLPAGTHTLKWTYTKDQATVSGLDSGFVDTFEVHTDADGDGIHSDLESYFGTSDSNANAQPQISVNRAASTALTFSSVNGNDYRVEYSDDLKKWTPVIVTGTGATTTWTDSNAVNKVQRFYRVLIP